MAKEKATGVKHGRDSTHVIETSCWIRRFPSRLDSAGPHLASGLGAVRGAASFLLEGAEVEGHWRTGRALPQQWQPTFWGNTRTGQAACDTTCCETVPPGVNAFLKRLPKLHEQTRKP